MCLAWSLAQSRCLRKIISLSTVLLPSSLSSLQGKTSKDATQSPQIASGTSAPQRSVLTRNVKVWEGQQRPGETVPTPGD